MDIKIPDGKGGWTTVEGNVGAVDQKADKTKQELALKNQFIADAGLLTEKLGKYAVAYCRENGLDETHAAFAIALLSVNLREDFPKGKEKFDDVARSAADYYDANVPVRK